MTDFTAIANGPWRNPATWDVGSGYPDGLDDNAIIGAWDIVTTASETEVCGQATIASGGFLNVSAGGTLQLGNTSDPALDVADGGELVITGRIEGQGTGGLSRIFMRSGSILIFPGSAHTLRRLELLLGVVVNISDLYGATSEADQLTLSLYPYLGGHLTIDEDCCVYSLGGEYASLTVNAGVDIRVASSQTVTLHSSLTSKLNGTLASPITISAYTAGAYINLRAKGNSSSYANFVTFSNIAFSYLGDNSTLYGFDFGKKPSKVTPINRKPIIETTQPLGRKLGREHYKGNQSAIVEIIGKWVVSAKQYDRVDAMMNNGSIVGFVDEPHQILIPSARIISHDYVREKGVLYWDYTIALQEVLD